MARVRTVAAELAKLLNSAALPIYVLDDEPTFVFGNRACLDWVGCTADELEGCRCVFHSDPEASGAQAAAAGLCPSPEAIAGNQARGIVSTCARDGRLRRRRARFFPLGDHPNDSVGLIVLVEGSDLAESERGIPPGEDEPDWLHECIRQFRHERAGRYGIDRLLGESPAIRRVRAQVELASQSEASVLVVGPRGSGRQRVAETPHYGRPSAGSGSMVSLACDLLGAELLRSTIVALAGRGPELDASSPNTLLLNDVDQLPAEVQAEAATVLGAQSFPFRLVATARQPLGNLAREGAYRDDLAAVLSTLLIELSPLVDRRADIPLLAQAFVEQQNTRGRKQVAGFTPEALDHLDGYGWPGNVDELAAMVAEAHKAAEGPTIDVGDLPGRIHLAADAAAHPRQPEEPIVLDEFLAKIEREVLRRALAQAKGNKAQAAKLLGMSRPRLYRRLVQLGLE